MKTKQTHVEAEVRPLLVDLVGVAWSNATEEREPIRVTGKVEVYSKVRNFFKHLENGLLVLLEKVLLVLLVG